MKLFHVFQAAIVLLFALVNASDLQIKPYHGTNDIRHENDHEYDFLAGQVFASFPNCSIACIIPGVLSDGCDIPDGKCHCMKYSGLKDLEFNCIAGACSPADIASFLKALQGLCSTFGVSLSLSNAAPTATGILSGNSTANITATATLASLSRLNNSTTVTTASAKTSSSTTTSATTTSVSTSSVSATAASATSARPTSGAMITKSLTKTFRAVTGWLLFEFALGFAGFLLVE